MKRKKNVFLIILLILILLLVVMLVIRGVVGSNHKGHKSGLISKAENSSLIAENSRLKRENDTGESYSDSSQLWNKRKDQQLTEFINRWAPTMGQSYVKYDGVNDIKTKPGMLYPSELKNTTVNGSEASIGWAPSGKGSYDYNVVALYNYDKPGNVAGHITYAFAFHDGSPVALVDQSTNGVPDWTPTKNEDVASHFEDIADD